MENDLAAGLSHEIPDEELNGVSGGASLPDLPIIAPIVAPKPTVKLYHSCGNYCCKRCGKREQALEGDNLNQYHKCQTGTNCYMGCYSCYYYSSPGSPEGKCNCSVINLPKRS